jgi:hypothetical protein
VSVTRTVGNRLIMQARSDRLVSVTVTETTARAVTPLRTDGRRSSARQLTATDGGGVLARLVPRAAGTCRPPHPVTIKAAATSARMALPLMPTPVYVASYRVTHSRPAWLPVSPVWRSIPPGGGERHLDDGETDAPDRHLPCVRRIYIPAAVSPHPDVSRPIEERGSVPGTDPAGHPVRPWGCAGWWNPVPARSGAGRRYPAAWGRDP